VEVEQVALVLKVIREIQALLQVQVLHLLLQPVVGAAEVLIVLANQEGLVVVEVVAKVSQVVLVDQQLEVDN